MASSSDPQLANRILRGLVIGLIAGVITLGIGQIWPDVLTFMQKVATQIFDPVGQVFLRLLFFVIIPIVFASLASGVLQLGQPERLGPLAGRTFFLFFINMAVGVGLGLLVMNVVQPGRFIDEETTKVLMASYGGASETVVANQKQAQEGLSLMMLVEMFMPRNLFGAFVGNSRASIGDVLPLILFAILVGAVGTKMAVDRREKLLEALNTVSELMTGIVHFALRLAPYAVPAMIYSVVVRVGLDIVIALGVFVLTCVGVLALHLFGTMTLWIKFWTTRKPTEYFAAIKGVLITAFSTSSSAATLPASIECAREKLKLSPSTSGFVLPLGATMNMSGTALYEGCVVLFIAQIFHVDLGMGQQLTLLLLSVLSAVAVAAIPGGSLPLIAGLLATFGVDPAGIGIILGIDRILDMCRTSVNVGFDLTTATIVDEYVKKTEAKAAASP
ncbi:MAG: dicarboxylate/amino acid:cation symporter [Candidatus Didemnitutus sp.]|nr:dicarboxylate/amino acid:cation symporter [Candidatus Didemnitutus sp.]